MILIGTSRAHCQGWTSWFQMHQGVSPGLNSGGGEGGET